jgi:DCN1-like protein 1/2
MSRQTRYQQQLRDQFIDFTQTTGSIADQFLRNSKYDLELAINNFLSYQASGSSKDNKTLGDVFDKYKDPSDENVIGIDGTIEYLADLGFEPEDKVTLALADFLDSPSVGVFERRSFILKWQSVDAKTLDDMKRHLEVLNSKLENDVGYLKQVYQFAFKFLLDEGQRTLPLETAIAYWELILKPIYGGKIDEWSKFLTEEWKQAISKDAWNMFFVFLQEYEQDPSLESYDETAAWPSLIDEFVEYHKEHLQQGRV